MLQSVVYGCAFGISLSLDHSISYIFFLRHQGVDRNLWGFCFVLWENLCSLGDPLSCVLVPACCAHQGSLIDFLIWTVAFSSEMKGFSDYFLLIFVRLLKLTGKFSVIRWGRLFPLTDIFMKVSSIAKSLALYCWP